ncbi:RNA polymerase sigma factor [Planctomycetota bacterium]
MECWSLGNQKRFFPITPVFHYSITPLPELRDLIKSELAHYYKFFVELQRLHIMELKELIQKSLSGNKEAFCDIIRMFHSKVRHYVAMQCYYEDFIDDITQEVFMQAYVSLHNYDTSRPFEGWLKGIIRNITNTHLRKHITKSKLRQDMVSDMIRAKLSDEESHGEHINNERIAALKECVKKLPKALQEIIFMRYTQEMTAVEIAAKIRKSTDSIRMRLMRMRESLEACILKKVKKEKTA